MKFLLLNLYTWMESVEQLAPKCPFITLACKYGERNSPGTSQSYNCLQDQQTKKNHRTVEHPPNCACSFNHHSKLTWSVDAELFVAWFTYTQSWNVASDWERSSYAVRSTMCHADCAGVIPAILQISGRRSSKSGPQLLDLKVLMAQRASAHTHTGLHVSPPQ